MPIIRRRHVISLIVVAALLVQFYYTYHTVKIRGRFVAIESNGGQIGNQLFHLCSGHGIATKLGRRQYIRTLNSEGFYIGKHLEKIEAIFPRLAQTFVIMNVWNEHRVPFAWRDGHMTCCDYEDPSRLKNRTEQFLVLDFRYAQNVRYFDFMLPEIRHLLAFSDDVQREGDQVLHRWNIHNATAMCVHIRRSDFVQLHVASDLQDSVRDVIRIADRQNFDEFIIFGDDTDFMRRMAEAIEMQRNGIRKSKARFSTNTEGVDFYIASRACGAMLITAPTSTFGWWLAFFIPNQDAVYYRGSDKRRMVDKVPQKDLFLSSWKAF